MNETKVDITTIGEFWQEKVVERDCSNSVEGIQKSHPML